MKNLLEETIKILEEYSKTPSDVLWVGDETVAFSWDYFASIADREYDSGFGGQEVLANLLVVGADWWLERFEYDGSEHWELKTMPIKPAKEYNMPSVFKDDYEDLEVWDYVWGEDTFQEILDKERTK